MSNTVAERRTILSADGVGRRFGSRWLFRNLDLDLREGEALIVRGANGSGKSTLLKLLAGLDSPTAGKIQLPERLGYAALDLALYATLTVAEHIEWAAAMRDVAPPILEPYGLESMPNLLAGALSSGQRSRLRFALAEIGNPELLILDEPGAALDESGQEIVDGIVARQRARGALILATNDPREARYGTHELRL